MKLTLEHAQSVVSRLEEKLHRRARLRADVLGLPRPEEEHWQAPQTIKQAAARVCFLVKRIDGLEAEIKSLEEAASDSERYILGALRMRGMQV